MPKQNEVLEPKKKKETVSLDENKKIDLYINSAQEDEQGISIMNIFSNMRKRFRMYLFVMIAGICLGLFVPAIMFNFRDRKETAIAILGLDYEGANEGLAPDGTELDISYLKSSYIIQNALSKVALSKNVSTAQVQSNLKITGVLTDETKQQQEVINKLLAEKNSEYGKMIKEFTLKYRSQYIISVSNYFGKSTLPSSDLSKLLNSITASYADYFVETYQDKKLPENILGAINTSSLDYLDILDSVSESLANLREYCKSHSELIPGFRSTAGLSFDDLIKIIDEKKTEYVDSAYSYVYVNNVSKDRDIQLTTYKYQKREALLDLDTINESIVSTKEQINNYKPDTIVIPRSDGNPPDVIDRTSDYYNSLVLRLTDLNDQKSTLEERIAILDYRITNLEGTPASEEQIQEADRYVEDAVDEAVDVYELANESAVQLISSNAYKNKYMHSITTFENESESQGFKYALMGAGIGLFTGAFIWLADGFILELIDNRKANSKKEDR